MKQILPERALNKKKYYKTFKIIPGKIIEKCQTTFLGCLFVRLTIGEIMIEHDMKNIETFSKSVVCEKFIIVTPSLKNQLDCSPASTFKLAKQNSNPI